MGRAGRGQNRGKDKSARIRETCWGRDEGIEVEDRHANKKRRQITAVVCVDAGVHANRVLSFI